MKSDFSEILSKIDKNHIWHPFTQMKDFNDIDMPIITRGEGIKVFDNKGNFYYDCISSWWCILHGHGNPKIKNAIKKQLDKLEQIIFAGFTHENAILLTKELLNYLPNNLTKFFFSDNGSTSCEVALKMSYQYRINRGENRPKFIAFERGYHGDTLGAMSVSGLSAFNSKFTGLFFPCYRIKSPYCYRCEWGYESCDSCGLDCLNEVRELLEKKFNEITAIILEPLLFAAGGMIFYPIRYLENLINLIRKYDIHIIFDEVATGFGRLGKMFAMDFLVENFGKPDFLCVSKGLTGGFLPLAITITTDEIYNCFYDDYEKGKTFFHGHTFTANPLSCAAALANIEIFREEDTLQKIVGNIEYLQKEKYRFLDIPIVGDIRGMGMICAFELVKDRGRKEPFDWKLRVGWRVFRKGLEKGLIVRPLGDVIYLFLPLSTTGEEIDFIINTLFEVFLNVISKDFV